MLLLQLLLQLLLRHLLQQLVLSSVKRLLQAAGEWRESSIWRHRSLRENKAMLLLRLLLRARGCRSDSGEGWRSRWQQLEGLLLSEGCCRLLLGIWGH